MMRRGAFADLVAAILAVAMMFGVALTGVLPLPQRAFAADGDGKAGLCQPADGSISSTLGGDGKDLGVATWVGRDMYVGSRPAAVSELGKVYPVSGSYAAEAEGLTLVHGKLAINKLGNSWNDNGFRFGAVGFGAGHTPPIGKKALGVGGIGSAITTLKSDGTNDGSVGAWNHGGFTGSGKGSKNKTDSFRYTASITGSRTNIDNNIKRATVVGTAGNYDPDQDTFGASSAAALTGNDGKDYTNYTQELQATSASFLKAPAFTRSNMADDIIFDNDDIRGKGRNVPTDKPGVYVGIAPTGEHWRNKYNDGNTKYKFEYDDTASNNDRLIVFNGDGRSSMQAFNVDAASFSSDGRRGLAFAFANIPKGASVLVNVTGNQPVSFHNAWRFWWNGSDIGNGYFGSDKQAAYNEAASSIMWNYAEATSLTILGGTYNKNDSRQSNDDPAAAVIGSIMVPHGDFDDHVTTNGRVWVAGDLMLDSPTYVGKISSYDTASVLGMDIERHNFAWRGSVHAECPALEWSKVANDGKPLPGSTFRVTYSLTDAQSDAGGILVTDGGFSDADGAANGGFEISNLNGDADYYVREVSAPEGYAVNPNIYRIHITGTTHAATSAITGAWKVTGEGASTNVSEIQGSNADKGLSENGAIIDPPAGTAIRWGKYDASDLDADGRPKKDARPLAGSKWAIAQTKDVNGATIDTAWAVDDNVLAPTGIVLKDDNNSDVPAGGIELKTIDGSNARRIKAEVSGPTGVSQETKWTVESTKIAVVSPTPDFNGYYTVSAIAPGTTTLTVCSAVDDSICAKVNITVSGPTVSSLTVTKNGVDVSGGSVDVQTGETITLAATAKVADGQGNPVITWTATDGADGGKVTLSATQGASVTVTGTAAGTVTVTASAGGKTTTVTVHVKDKPKTTTIYVKWKNKQPNIHYYNVNGLKGTTWPGVRMTSCGGDWYSYEIQAAGTSITFIINSGSDRYQVNTLSGAPGTTVVNTPNQKSVTVTGASPVYIIENSAITASEHAPAGVVCPASKSVARHSSIAVHRTSSSRSDYGKDMRRANVLAADEAAQTEQVACVASDGIASTPGVKCDLDARVGMFEVDGLADGTYTLTETAAPAGYRTGGPWTFTITSGKVTWNQAPDGQGGTTGKTPAWINAGTNCDSDSTNDACAVAIGNQREPGRVDWRKVEAGAGDVSTAVKLGGSEWKLTQTGRYDTASQAIVPIADSSAQPTAAITDCSAEGSCKASGTGTATTPAWFDSNVQAGEFAITNLDWGEYTLVETKAPDGHIVNMVNDASVTYTFDVTYDATQKAVVTTWLNVDKGDAAKTPGLTVANNGKPVPADAQPGVGAMATITNRKLLTAMPSSGNANHLWLMVTGGCVLVVISAALARSSERRRRPMAAHSRQ